MLSRLQDTRANLIWHAFPEAVYGGEFTLSGCTPGDETSVYFSSPKPASVPRALPSRPFERAGGGPARPLRHDQNPAGR